jgi:hypothetical protein
MGQFRGLLLALVVCAISVPVSADVIISIDENGHGVLDFSSQGGGVFNMPFALRSDPGPGGLASVLTYNLLGPPSLVAGDVLLQDGVNGPIFDVIRFNSAGTGNANYPASVLFYSDNVDGVDALGDTPSPPGSLYTNVVTRLEVGPEGFNGAFNYTPTSSQPGFVQGFVVHYNFISDGNVPEPGTWALALTGLGLAALKLRHRK